MTSPLDNVETSDNRIDFDLTVFGDSCIANIRVSFKIISDDQIEFTTMTSDFENIGLDSTTFNLKSYENEKVFGFGEQYNHLNFKGLNVPILVREQGHTRGKQPPAAVISLVSPIVVGDWSTTYAPIPFMMRSNHTSFFLENTDYSEFNLKEKDAFRISVWSKNIKSKISHADKYLDLVSIFTRDSGRPKPIADWYHKGAIVGIMGHSIRV